MPPILTEHLPQWVAWAVPVLFPVLAMIWLPVAQALATRFVTEADDPSAHWTERARLLFIRYRVWALTGLGVMILFVGFGYRLMGPLQIVSGKTMVVSLGLALLLEFEYLSWRFSIRNGWSKGTLAQHFTLWAINLIVLRNFYITMVAMALFVPSKGSGMVTGLAVGLTLLFLGTQVFRLKVFRILGLVKKAPPRLMDIVERSVANTGISPKGVYLVNSRWANAYAYPPQGDLMFTARALKILNDDELQSITEHELGHLKEGSSRWLVSFGTLAPFAVVGAWHPISNTFGEVGFSVALILGVLSQIVSIRGSRRREIAADAHAISHAQKEGVYARALEKLYCSSLSPVVTGSKSSTHPDLYDRMEAAGVVPNYPRPQTTSLGRKGNRKMVIAIVLLLGLPIWSASAAVVEVDRMAYETGEKQWVNRALACGAGASVLIKLGGEALAESPRRALAYFFTAADTKPKWWIVHVYLAQTLESLDRDAEALAQWNEAEVLYNSSKNQEEWFPGLLEEARRRLGDAKDNG